MQRKFLTLASCYTVSPMSTYCHNYDPIIAHLGLMAAPTAFYLSRSLVYIHCNQSADCFSRYLHMLDFHIFAHCLRSHTFFKLETHRTLYSQNNCFNRICLSANRFCDVLPFVIQTIYYLWRYLIYNTGLTLRYDINLYDT